MEQLLDIKNSCSDCKLKRENKCKHFNESWFQDSDLVKNVASLIENMYNVSNVRVGVHIFYCSNFERYQPESMLDIVTYKLQNNKPLTSEEEQFVNNLLNN